MYCPTDKNQYLADKIISTDQFTKIQCPMDKNSFPSCYKPCCVPAFWISGI
uniref:Uncharacterized protein n=1 Tax=Arundo donax TaxID=35708 RepID=A0A0A9CCG4_ARUDO